MEVLDQIYHQFFFTANSVGRQLTTSQYFQPLPAQIIALAATAIHCALSEYAGGMKPTGMFSQDEYQGTFCPFPVIKSTPEATALINHTVVGSLISHLCHISAGIGVPQFPLALLSLHWCSSMSFRAPRLAMGAPPLPPRLLVWIVAHIFHSIFSPSPFFSALLHWDCTRQSPSVLLCQDWRSSIWFRTPYLLFSTPPIVWANFNPIGTPQPRFGALHFHSTLLQHLLCTPLSHTAFPVWSSSVPGSCSLFRPNISCSLWNPHLNLLTANFRLHLC